MLVINILAYTQFIQSYFVRLREVEELIFFGTMY